MFTQVYLFEADIDKGGILDLIRSNVKRNKEFVKKPVQVTGLDFMLPLSQEMKKELQNIEMILAADGECLAKRYILASKASLMSIEPKHVYFFSVIYDDHVTEAFVDTVIQLFDDGKSRSVYVALEKRVVFTLDELGAVAPCYEHFLACLRKLPKLNIRTEQLSTDFQQYFQYDKVKQLVLWKIFR